MIELKGDRFILDLKYNSTDNFLKRNLYAEFGLDKCYVHPDLYEKLVKLQQPLKELQLKLVLFDGYRPVEVQQQMWNAVPDERYIANPQKGSNHNRGIALDCGLAKEDGTYLEFPTEFDDFSEKAWHAHVCSAQETQLCKNRDLLHELMKSIGLVTYPTEWWHYQLSQSAKYPIVPVSEVLRG